MKNHLIYEFNKNNRMLAIAAIINILNFSDMEEDEYKMRRVQNFCVVCEMCRVQNFCVF